MKTILALLLFVSSTAFADSWSTGDTYREGTYLGLLAIDWSQTRNCLRKPYCSEANPLLGRHPEQSHLDAAVILTGTAQYLIARALPTEYRTPFQYVSIGIEFGAAYHNLSFGIAAKF